MHNMWLSVLDSVHWHPGSVSLLVCETPAQSAETRTPWVSGCVRPRLCLQRPEWVCEVRAAGIRPPQLHLETSALQCNFSNTPSYIYILFLYGTQTGFEETHPYVWLLPSAGVTTCSDQTSHKKNWLLFYTGWPSWCNLSSNLQLQDHKTTVLTIKLPRPQILS